MAAARRMMDKPLHDRDGLENFIETINVAIWIALGCAIGFLYTKMNPTGSHTVYVENMAVAVFGSFIGGEFVSVLLRDSPKVTSLTVTSFALAAACSVVTLMLLSLMRRKVGPLRDGKSRSRQR